MAPKTKKEEGVKASTKKLNTLHDKIADYFSECLDSGEDLSSGTLSAMITFLKNNNVSADVSESNPLQNLSYKIAELVKENEA